MNKIFNNINKKTISLDKFIEFALYDKKNGYYMNRNPLGKKGDFITAPLISPLFGEMLAIWCISYWKHLGEPKKIFLVELGPGDGSLCEDMLSVFKKFPKFYNSIKIHLYEISSNLKKIQKSRKYGNKKVSWINKIQDINSGPVIFLGNEFFDSLAIKQLFKKNNFFFEKYVFLDKKRKKAKFVLKKANKSIVSKIKKLKLANRVGVIEYPIKSINYLTQISKKINKLDGCLLAIDYGYNKKTNNSSLQSVKNHRYSNILSDIGSSDITSHINFNLFSKILISNNLYVSKIVNQSEFLQKMGINERASILSQNMAFSKKVKMYYDLKRLVDYRFMGNHFKVLFAQKKNKKFSLGF